jgi:hypothetical protein
MNVGALVIFINVTSDAATSCVFIGELVVTEVDLDRAGAVSTNGREVYMTLPGERCS